MEIHPDLRRHVLPREQAKTQSPQVIQQIF